MLRGVVLVMLLCQTTGAWAQRPTLTATRELLLSGADLDFVTISQMVVDSRGRMYLWQDDDARIRRFESDGAELDPIAGAGEGPGEFRMRSFGGMVGDTFWVSDPMLRRTTFFTPDGKLLRTQRWAFGVTRGEDYYPAGIGLQPLVVEPAGTWLVTLGRVTLSEMPSWWTPADAGYAHLRVDTTGQFVRLLGTSPRFSNRCARDFQVPGRPPGGTIGVPFCQNTHTYTSLGQNRAVQVVPDTVRQGNFAITAARLDGTEIYSATFHQPLVRIPREVADSARRERMKPLPGPVPGANRARATAYERMRFPDFYPAVTDLCVGRDGSAWVALRRKARERDWLVFGPDGRERGVVTLPASFHMSRADGERIWGTIVDEDDLPSVVRYRVH